MSARSDAARGALPIKLAVVVPCYNETETLPATIPRLLTALADLSSSHGCSRDSFLVFVDDGSSDETWKQIKAAAAAHPGQVRGVSLAANVGHQHALLAGLDYATDRCDAAISLDADLQDDLAAFPRMVREFCSGAEIVLGVKKSRKSDTWFKRGTAVLFYRAMRVLGVDLVHNHADFRLLSAATLRSLRAFSEYNLFLRAFPPLLHRKIAVVEFDRLPRLSGKSKYSLAGMLALAWNGITSFSVFPLRIINLVGGLVFLGASLLALYAFVNATSGRTVPGWASITVPLYMLGGLIMLSVGIVGEYLGKIFLEVKKRPRFLVDEIVGDTSDEARR